MTHSMVPQSASAPVAPSGSIGGQGVRFFLIGSVGTILQLGVYAAGATLVGAQFASVVSWLVSTLVTNAAHRALTFGVRGAQRNRADQSVAFLTSVVGLLITSLVLAELPDADGISGLMAILAVNTVVGIGRFVGLRWWLGEGGPRVSRRARSAPLAMREHRPATA
jgi:putative flippase GtrA